MVNQDDASQNSFISKFKKIGSFTAKFKDNENLSDNQFSDSMKKKSDEGAFSDRKSIIRNSKRESFAESAKKSRIDCLFLVRGKDKGRCAWHYVLVDKNKREMFLAKSRSGSIDVALYGQILYSGWGENPPEDIVKKIEDEYGGS
ncbi:hypothetical protein HL033_00205 [Neoehrlichia mikurensis]|uniref:Uncharacterized protein n=1 Tax=Neoehrlichia mikurensis TaxID=89586 RepID=A0A9Q9BS46_9RICK|nr:hypothetical protein [Neoehrlichia mikurensis]QXK92002.1 hypothetical protein IAH97_00205 [Neoehrlichia mikurensis]QXK92459.1 hypothetical protein HUN61_00205 [Neoehrlichia mikurensis]QXK93695.1 hypothetical protein HL033_00205 [Neoehrlichia mikurensis]UTO55332.1 hypothetical protein LUA82_04075 [Neoehrlichia mikurensis]UTO56253.1 hypothetical protein LUA81_04040 [Neoehrlichia mikurensis]